LAVGDIKGRVSIVEFDGRDFTKKNEFFIVQGQVNELIWSKDEKMLVALGET
jgi:hypothetical protein